MQTSSQDSVRSRGGKEEKVCSLVSSIIGLHLRGEGGGERVMLFRKRILRTKRGQVEGGQGAGNMTVGQEGGVPFDVRGLEVIY